jgi:hypothetical protein
MPLPKFKVVFHNEALEQLQQSINYYNAAQKGLGKRFALVVKATAGQLDKTPFYQIRYDDICCFPLQKFPFMLHFRVNEDLNVVEIFAVLHTSLNPIWDLENDRNK